MIVLTAQTVSGVNSLALKSAACGPTTYTDAAALSAASTNSNAFPSGFWSMTCAAATTQAVSTDIFTLNKLCAALAGPTVAATACSDTVYSGSYRNGYLTALTCGGVAFADKASINPTTAITSCTTVKAMCPSE